MTNRSRQETALDEDRGHDRRAFHRFSLGADQLTAEVGSEGLRSARARVQDISLGGVKLSLDKKVDRAGVGQCVVRFLDDRTAIRPAAIRGRILRSGGGHGDYYIAVQFTQPLDELSVTG